MTSEMTDMMGLLNVLPGIRQPKGSDLYQLQEGLIVEVAKYLNEKSIPCVLISESAWAVHCLIYSMPSVDFVIKDTDEFRMCEVLHMNKSEVIEVGYPPAVPMGFAKCSDSPAFHLRFVKFGLHPVRIWKQSQIWWQMPPIPAAFVHPREATLDPEDYLLAEDVAVVPVPSRYKSARPFSKGFYPVIVPTPARLFEHAIALKARNAWPMKHDRPFCIGFDQMADLWEYFKKEVFDISKCRLPFRIYFEALNTRGEPPFCVALRDLRRYLGEPVTAEAESAAIDDKKRLAKWLRRRAQIARRAVRDPAEPDTDSEAEAEACANDDTNTDSAAQEKKDAN